MLYYGTLNEYKRLSGLYFYKVLSFISFNGFYSKIR